MRAKNRIGIGSTISFRPRSLMANAAQSAAASIVEYSNDDENVPTGLTEFSTRSDSEAAVWYQILSHGGWPTNACQRPYPAITVPHQISSTIKRSTVRSSTTARPTKYRPSGGPQ